MVVRVTDGFQEPNWTTTSRTTSTSITPTMSARWMVPVVWFDLKHAGVNIISIGRRFVGISKLAADGVLSGENTIAIGLGSVQERDVLNRDRKPGVSANASPLCCLWRRVRRCCRRVRPFCRKGCLGGFAITLAPRPARQADVPGCCRNDRECKPEEITGLKKSQV